MAPYVMTMIGMILVWNAASCSARPAALTEDESLNVVATELDWNDKHAIPQVEIEKSHKLSMKAFYRLFETVRSNRKLNEKRREKPAKTPEAEPRPTEASTSKPVYEKDRVLDQLLDHMGDKQPIHHSALDGWIF